MAKLMGMKEICRYVNRAENTVVGMIERQGFPAWKVGGGYESETEKVDAWKTRQAVAPDLMGILDELARRIDKLEESAGKLVVAARDAYKSPPVEPVSKGKRRAG